MRARKTDFPLVSVVIPTFNQAPFLKEAITSAQNQTYSNIEIVVVNDGSTDNTVEILKTLSKNDPRICFFNQDNQGFASATNKAIRESQGEYIAHLDSDDIYEPNKIEMQLKALLETKNIDLVHTAVLVIDIQGKPLMELHGTDFDPDTFLAKMLFRNIMPNPTTLMGKRSCFLDVSCSEKYKRSVDYDRILRLAEKYHLKYLDLPLTRWRRHEHNISNDLEIHRREQLDILKSYKIVDLMSYVDKAKLSTEEKTLLKGNILYNIEKWEEALTEFQQLKSSSGSFYRGNCFYRLKNFEQAIASYRNCLLQDPKHAACWNNLGVALRNAPEASDCFRKALEIKPDYLDPQLNLSTPTKRLTDRELRNELIPYKI